MWTEGPREAAVPTRALGQNRGRLQCYHCGQEGHMRKDCPRWKATGTPTTEEAVIRTINIIDEGKLALCTECTQSVKTASFRKAVRVNNPPATALRNTGADMLCIRGDLIPDPCFTGRKQRIRYANTGSTYAPLALVYSESPYYRGKEEAALIPRLVEEVIIVKSRYYATYRDRAKVA
ncbi:hypothetical protein C0Q70_12519 [Pomacea canaliculata]|uniref:CCHC-type domain-containing protein n=1 Tax=Pomacea canaliculata TaxID=400727 RepID=A0A2T7P1Q7_POMCA|nr:hypothetical protein C0Q70_12519 [Pomacea canaliculata]